jgi:ABC-2 type transport system permease protein
MFSSNSPRLKFFAFAYRNWIIYLRNLFTAFELLFWPVVSLLSVGLMTTFLKLDGNTTTFILIGAIAFSLVQVAQMDVSYILLFDSWSKSIKHTFIAPVRGYHFVIGAWVMGMLRGLVVFLVLSLFSALVFSFDFLQPGPLPLLWFLLGLFINAAVIGTGVCILYVTFGQRAEVAAWTMVGFLMVLCGVYYPVSVLPAAVRAVSALIPLTHFLEHFRSFYGFESVFSWSLVWGFSLGVLYFAAGLLLLELAVTRARRSGLITKLSE